MLAASLLFLAGLCPASDSGIQSVAPTAPAPQTQGPMSPIQNVGGGQLPSGGTPEPATMLLLVGGALGYGANRLRRARQNRNSGS